MNKPVELGVRADLGGEAAVAAAVDLTDASRRRRSAVAEHLPPSLFPSTRDQLVLAATRRAAPAEVTDLLRSLTPGRLFENVVEVVAELASTRRRGSVRGPATPVASGRRA